MTASRNLTRALPTLGINGSLVSVSGLSSGADMAVQFHVAHSSRVMGAAIFAGEPYHCALTLFPAEMAQGISEPPPYDHCKSTPEVRSSPKGCLVKLSDVSPSRPPSQKVVEPGSSSRRRAAAQRSRIDTPTRTCAARACTCTAAATTRRTSTAR